MQYSRYPGVARLASGTTANRPACFSFRAGASVGPDQTHENALNFHLVFGEDASFIGRVRRFQRDGIALAQEPFQRGFVAFDLSNDHIAGFG